MSAPPRGLTQSRDSEVTKVLACELDCDSWFLLGSQGHDEGISRQPEKPADRSPLGRVYMAPVLPQQCRAGGPMADGRETRSRTRRGLIPPPQPQTPRSFSRNIFPKGTCLSFLSASPSNRCWVPSTGGPRRNVPPNVEIPTPKVMKLGAGAFGR